MTIFIKLLAAIGLGILMIFSSMMIVIVGTTFIGFIASIAGLDTLSKSMYNIQVKVWERTKRWFFRYRS